MKVLRSIVWILIIASLAIMGEACNGSAGSGGHPDFDLLSYGVPLKIKAPEDSVVNVDDLGIVQDITVVSGDAFNLQILAGTAYVSDVSTVVEKQKSDAMTSSTFSKMIEEEGNGFIFEKKYSEERISYDFRYVRLQGDKEFIFQTGLLGQFTLEQVKEMYNSVK